MTRRTRSAPSAPAAGARSPRPGWPARRTSCVTVTLSKALGSQGGAVLGARAGDRPSRRRRAHVHLRHRPRPGLRGQRARRAAGAAGASRSAQRGCARSPPASPLPSARPRPAAAVVSLVLGEPEPALAAAAACAREGVQVGCFRPPVRAGGHQPAADRRARRPDRRRGRAGDPGDQPAAISR